MAANPDNPVPAAASADRGGAHGTRLRVDCPEDVGGHLSMPGASIIPSDVSQLVLDQSARSGDLAAMHAKFIADFAGESIARRHDGRRPQSGPASDER
jgi:hypothetical protein